MGIRDTRLDIHDTLQEAFRSQDWLPLATVTKWVIAVEVVTDSSTRRVYDFSGSADLQSIPPWERIGLMAALVMPSAPPPPPPEEEPS